MLVLLSMMTLSDVCFEDWYFLLQYSLDIFGFQNSTEEHIYRRGELMGKRKYLYVNNKTKCVSF